MANAFEEFDELDLPDLPDDFSDSDEATLQEDLEDFPPSNKRRSSLSAPTASPYKDRFAALLLDIAFIYLFYWFFAYLYLFIAKGTLFGAIPLFGFHGVFLHVLFFLLTLLFFSFFETVLQASPGKLLCSLKIAKTNGENLSFVSALLRNLLKPLDLLLCFTLVNLIVLDQTRYRQRIGDLLAKTFVIQIKKKTPFPPQLHKAELASGSGRLCAGLIDFIFFAAFLFGLLFSFSPNHPQGSLLLLLLLPLLAFSYLIFFQQILKTSPGKFFFAYEIIQERRSPLLFSSAVVRTFLYIFDLLPSSLLPVILSEKHQRLGDLAAGTIVVKWKRSIRGAIAFALGLILSGGLLASQLEVRDNILTENFYLNFLPRFSSSSVAVDEKKLFGNLVLSELSFSEGPDLEVRTVPLFVPGETVYMSFVITGFELKGGKAWLTDDLQVQYPDNSLGLSLEKAIEYHDYANENMPITFTNSLTLPENSTSGRYNIVITLRDKHAEKEVREFRYFYVKASEPTPVIKKSPAPEIREEISEEPSFRNEDETNNDTRYFREESRGGRDEFLY
ncbi:MAG: hypothetical protein COX62_04300 [Deltaproteobacteria bacterium CG_4_10_14_0_2_um_filter_43_8]|nr:MAG: hypothetical protein COV43_06820 [Deltaproteobacteria bacterium CG11_big_fil_rev_8_21_14_0_20_42_23]PJA20616.1 MAG: hypothetical protein COX62_04300 [Deltaproteobacteria bacterium CG_4_10_14_0_2_um_filter_43_8]PJC65228.1 MAG: hypothetical protein CO021_00125 [Deltaproteobacteria bacterium CG_4_9_14_0_2_um_filter_42_21]